MDRAALFERIYDEVCDPWTMTEDEKEEEKKCFFKALETGDIWDYVKSIEETRDCVCKPSDGVHGCYDFEEMRKFDCLIEELTNMTMKTETKIVEYYSENGDITFLMKETWCGEDPVESEVVGFYYGTPNGNDTEYFKDRGVKTTYNR